MPRRMSEDFERNRRAWDAASDAYQAAHGAQLAAAPEAWGVWSLPETELHMLGEVHERDVLEYGCGAAQWSIALARRGARVVGLDNSERQLVHAARNIEMAALDVPLVHAAAEETPFADASFDLVFCDHGAMSFAAPERTIPEVARILRPRGVLAFSVEHPLHAAAWDDRQNAPSRQLHHPYFSLDRIVDPDDDGVGFARPIATYIALLHAHGFVLEKLLEPRPDPHASSTYREYVSLDWARDFPAELLIRARRAGG